MKTTTRFLLAAILIALTFTFSCDSTSNPSALVGRWIEVFGENKGDVLELLSDGTGILTKDSEGIAITWKTENGRFYITASGKAQSQNYKLQGSLTFTDDKGEISEYTKCKQDCQEAVKEYVKAKAEAEAKAKAEALKAKFAGVKKGSFTDSRHGKSYKTLKFDNQTWMAENLDYNANGSKCFNNSESNCQKYGRLYNWKIALSACPQGWHLPSNKEWQILVDFTGGDATAGNILKATSGWKDDSNGVDAVGFTALPGGAGNPDGSFLKVGDVGVWWSSSEDSSNYAYGWDIYYRNEGAHYWRNYDKDCLFSVRCVKDE